ncbi:MAG: MFS transporter [Spirochaetes bacterium]|nr:MFS transporter [Spirochaetota bacterium]
MRIAMSYNRYRYAIFWVLAVSYILVYFHRLCAAVVAVDMMEDLKTGGALMGMLGAAYYYPYAAMQLPAGLLSDAWGARRTITLFFGIAAVGSIVLGLAPSLSWAIAGRTLVGIGVAMLFVPTLKILSEWFREREFARMTGLLIAMGGVGTLSATFPLALLSNEVGWRNSFVIIGLITMICALLIWILVLDKPGDAGFPPVRKEPPAGGPAITVASAVKLVVSHPRFWTISLWFFFNCVIFFAFSGLWGGPYLMHVHGLTKTESGNILSMIAAGMIIGSSALSYLSDRVFRARKPVIVISSVISLMITAVLAFHTADISVAGLYALCFIMGVFNNAIVTIGFTATKELFPIRIAGTSTGLVNLFPFLGGALAQPFLGYLLERRGRSGDAFLLAGYQDAFLALFISGVIALAASFFIKETMRK